MFLLLIYSINLFIMFLIIFAFNVILIIKVIIIIMFMIFAIKFDVVFCKQKQQKQTNQQSCC